MDEGDQRGARGHPRVLPVRLHRHQRGDDGQRGARFPELVFDRTLIPFIATVEQARDVVVQLDAATHGPVPPLVFTTAAVDEVRVELHRTTAPMIDFFGMHMDYVEEQLGRTTPAPVERSTTASSSMTSCRTGAERGGDAASWVGGDISGLPAMGASMSAVTGDLDDAVRLLNAGTDTVAGDAGSSGVPDARNVGAVTTLPQSEIDAHDRLRDARVELRSEKQVYAQKGLRVPAENLPRLGHSGAVQDLRRLEAELEAARAGVGELPLSRALSTSPVDAERLIPALGRALPEGLGFLREIPFVDVAATAVVGELQARDDMEKGWTGTEARIKDYGAGAIGLAAGGALAVGIAAIGGGPIAVAAGAGAFVIGVGDLAYEAFHEHWDQDIQEDGVMPGILHGAGNVMTNTGDDLKDMLTGLWHSVF